MFYGKVWRLWDFFDGHMSLTDLLDFIWAHIFFDVLQHSIDILPFELFHSILDLVDKIGI